MDLSNCYDNSVIRRQDKLMEYERAVELLTEVEYGFLALGGKEGYGIPLNFVLAGNKIYFHCAIEGEKLRRIEANDNVCFCVVGHTKPQPAKFSTQYESVLVFGKVEIVADISEKMKALECIVEKYAPEFKETGKKYAEKSLGRTAILSLEIERISGKTKKIV